ncbi:MAG: hypothetical protein AB7S88_00140 [Candidatus Izemoplasmatales bacterium]
MIKMTYIRKSIGFIYLFTGILWLIMTILRSLSYIYQKEFIVLFLAILFALNAFLNLFLATRFLKQRYYLRFDEDRVEKKYGIFKISFLFSDIQDIRLVQSMFGKHLRIKTKSNQIYIGDVYDMPILEIRNIILGKFHEAQAELVE